MAQREFDIVISPKGEVQLEVKGYKGKTCLEAMRLFESIVGELKSESHTSEYYEPDEVVQFRIDQRH